MQKMERQSRVETGADVVSYLAAIVPAEIREYEFTGSAWEMILKSQDRNLHEGSAVQKNDLLNVVIAFVTGVRNNLDCRLRFQMKPSGEADLIPLQEGDEEMLTTVIERLDVFIFELLESKSSSLGLAIFDKDEGDDENSGVEAFLREHSIFQQLLSEQIADIRLPREAFECFAAAILEVLEVNPKLSIKNEEIVVTVGNLLEVPALVSGGAIYRAVKLCVSFDTDFDLDLEMEGGWSGDFIFWVPMEDIVLKPVPPQKSDYVKGEYLPRKLVQ